jgi:hypothetical protein
LIIRMITIQQVDAMSLNSLDLNLVLAPGCRG